MRTHNARHEQVAAPAHAVTMVPDWVKDTMGFEYGVKDGSIVDLTPPKTSPVVVESKTVPAMVEPKDETPKDETPKDETPKDEPPKDETPKDEPPKDETSRTRSRIPKGIVSSTTVVKK